MITRSRSRVLSAPHHLTPIALATRPRGLRARLGMTLIETTVVLIVAVAGMTAGASMYSDYLNNLSYRASATQLSDVSKALEEYIDDNFQTVLAQTIASGGRMTIPLAELSPDYLRDGFVNRTPHNHEYNLRVRRPDPGSNKLEAIVYTSYSNEDFAMEPKDGQAIAHLVGASAGYTTEIDPQAVTTTYQGFELDLADFGVNPGRGVLVSSIAMNRATDPGEKYLHRSVTGDPDHNRMNTNIDMASNDINNARTINTEVANVSVLLDAERGEIRTDLDVGGTATANLLVGETGVETQGNSGWRNTTHGSGWYMEDNTAIRAYNNFHVVTGGAVHGWQFWSHDGEPGGATGMRITNTGIYKIGDMMRVQTGSPNLPYPTGEDGPGGLTSTGHGKIALQPVGGEVVIGNSAYAPTVQTLWVHGMATVQGDSRLLGRVEVFGNVDVNGQVDANDVYSRSAGTTLSQLAQDHRNLKQAFDTHSHPQYAHVGHSHPEYASAGHSH